MELNKYTFTGRGLAMDATCVVLAYSEAGAAHLAESCMPLPETMRLANSIGAGVTGKPQIVYFWNGDY